MATLKELATQRSDIFWLPPEKIKVKNGWNARDPDEPGNREWVESLAQSIAEVGVKDPLVVHYENGEVYCVDGHCRLAAVALAKQRGAEIVSVPVKSEGRGSSEPDRLLLQVLEGKAKTPLEQGRVYKRLTGFGWHEQQIAARVGCSRAHIVQCLELVGAPHEVQTMVENGKVSSTLAHKVVKEHGGEKAAAVLDRASKRAARRGKTHATAKDLTVPKKEKEDSLVERRIRKHALKLYGGVEKVVDLLDGVPEGKLDKRWEALFYELRELLTTASGKSAYSVLDDAA